jgi:hypothetical protein
VRYFLGLFAIIALLIILIIILIPSGAKNPSKTNSLISYANTGAVVRLTIDGPEVSNQDHQEVQITVGKSNVTYAQLTGYNGQVVQVQNFANTEAAYDVFLRSLYYAGYNEGNSSSSLSDERGVCALGNRYVYEIINGSSEIQRYWSTSCGGAKTFSGNVSQTISLFKNQIPNYNGLTSSISF